MLKKNIAGAVSLLAATLVLPGAAAFAHSVPAAAGVKAEASKTAQPIAYRHYEHRYPAYRHHYYRPYAYQSPMYRPYAYGGFAPGGYYSNGYYGWGGNPAGYWGGNGWGPSVGIGIAPGVGIGFGF